MTSSRGSHLEADTKAAHDSNNGQEACQHAGLGVGPLTACTAGEQRLSQPCLPSATPTLVTSSTLAARWITDLCLSVLHALPEAAPRRHCADAVYVQAVMEVGLEQAGRYMFPVLNLVLLDRWQGRQQSSWPAWLPSLALRAGW